MNVMKPYHVTSRLNNAVVKDYFGICNSDYRNYAMQFLYVSLVLLSDDMMPLKGEPRFRAAEETLNGVIAP